MTKRPGPSVRTSPKSTTSDGRKPTAKGTKSAVARADRRTKIADHCAAAKAIADEIGDDFLAYMLAMVIQEARTSSSSQS